MHWTGEIFTDKFFFGKPEGRIPCEQHKQKWKDNNMMDLKENRIGGCVLDSSGSRLGTTVGLL
jgi:hypothetical protein